MIYVPVPKAAQRTMRYVLKSEGFVRSKDISFPKDYYTFTLIRNPYHRYISAHITARMRHVRAEYVRINEKKRAGPRIQDELYKNTKEANNGLWKLFVQSIEKPENQHYSPQVYLLRDKDKNPIAIDLYLVLDHLESGLCELETLFDLKLKRCHDHAAPQCWKDFLFNKLSKHPEYATRINAMYSEDWDLYNRVVGEWNAR
jgi:hypothetical protein